MSDEEKQIGRIKAILFASESTIERAKEHGDRDTVLMAKETAYDHILGVVDDVNYNPWQE